MSPALENDVDLKTDGARMMRWFVRMSVFDNPAEAAGHRGWLCSALGAASPSLSK